jgi:DNA-binding transcriptional LysR family regulator
MQTGHIAIGSGAMITSYLLPDLIAQYKERFPHVEVSVVEGGEEELKRMLLDGVIDLVLENCDFPETLFERQFFQQEHIVLAVPKSWPINRELLAWQQSIDNIVSGAYLGCRYPAVPLTAFQDCPFILLGPGDDNYIRAMALCREQGFTPKAILTLNQQLSSYNMACAGMGAAFVSDTLVKSTIPHPGMVYYKLDGAAAQRDIRFYYKRNRYLSRCVSQFLQDAAAVTKKLEKS